MAEHLFPIPDALRPRLTLSGVSAARRHRSQLLHCLCRLAQVESTP